MVRAIINFSTIKEVLVKKDHVEIILVGGQENMRPGPSDSVTLYKEEVMGIRLDESFFPVIEVTRGSAAHRRLVKQFNNDHI